MKILHTMIRVKDLEKSLEFYKNALGYEESRVRDFPEYKFTLVYLKLPGDDQELELTYNYGNGEYDLGNGYGHIALGCENFIELHERLRNEGYDVTELKGLTDTANYFFVKDPDGYKIEIIKC